MRSRLMRVGGYSLGLAIALFSIGHVVTAQAPPGWSAGN